MENIVTVIFNVESEAYQAFTELRQTPFGEGYAVAEASLIKHEGNGVSVVEAFDAAEVTSDDTANGMLVGSLVGILGGPLGVLLGASIGAYVGSTRDTVDAINSVSLLEAIAGKLYDGDVAIVALVEEEEPAFDAAFEKYQTTIIRHFAADVMDEVEHAREIEADLANQAVQRVRAKWEKTVNEAEDIASAEFVSATKEMMGTK